MNKDLILKKNDKVTYTDSFDNNFTLTINDYSEHSIKNFEEDGCKVLKVERPIKYETIYELKEILNDKEKEYLSAVIKPFKNRVEYIIKKLSSCNSTDEYIVIEVINEGCIALPYFKKDTMYKGMELGKEYTLKELGLD